MSFSFRSYLVPMRAYHSQRMKAEQSLIQRHRNLLKSASRFIDASGEGLVRQTPGPYATRIHQEKKLKLDGGIYRYLRGQLLHLCPGRVWDRIAMNRQKLGSRVLFLGMFWPRVKTLSRDRKGVGANALATGSATITSSGSRSSFSANGSIPAVVIIGRSNVGKSSLINALIGTHSSIVKDMPGSTKQSTVFRVENRVDLIDCPGYGFSYSHGEHRAAMDDEILGLLDADEQSISRVVRFLLVVDSRHGVTETDSEVIEHLLQRRIPFTLVVNKCDLVPAQTLARRISYIINRVSEMKDGSREREAEPERTIPGDKRRETASPSRSGNLIEVGAGESEVIPVCAKRGLGMQKLAAEIERLALSRPMKSECDVSRRASTQAGSLKEKVLDVKAASEQEEKHVLLSKWGVTPAEVDPWIVAGQHSSGKLFSEIRSTRFSGASLSSKLTDLVRRSAEEIRDELGIKS